MQHSAQTGSSRREERTPFDVLVELRGSESDDRLEADGLNVSMGGIAVRAASAPALGALLECRFRCPPDGELVCAQGEVTWISGGAHEGAFGLRFVELDTKSATTLRRYLAPSRPSQTPPERMRSATLLIDGLAATVEADLKLADETRIVLEQQLSFLQLGRGIEVQVLGREKKRGRIASVELRHTDFDVPTLVFGILLDGAPERAVLPDASGVAPLFGEVRARERAAATSEAAAYAPSPSLDEPFVSLTKSDALADSDALVDSDEVTSRVAASPRNLPVSPGGQHAPLVAQAPVDAALDDAALDDAALDDAALDDAAFDDEEPSSADAAFEDEEHTLADAPLQAGDEPTTANAALERGADHARFDDGELAEEYAGGENDEPGADYASWEEPPEDDDEQQPSPGQQLAVRLRGVPERLRLALRGIALQLSRWRQRMAPALREQAEALELPDVKTRLLLHVARVRGLALRMVKRRRASRPRVTRPPPLRMQRTTLPGVGPHDGAVSTPRSVQRTRVGAAVLVMVGVGLGAYALAPRSGADRIRLPERVERAPTEQAAADETPGEDFAAALGELAPEVIDEPPPPPPAERAATPAPSPSKPAPSFGDEEVPNGRVFVLRMNGPVEVLKGERRELGFSVRVPRRLSLDRASPIAQAHPAVTRAMILNRGGYAELTVDFAPGQAPRYRVVGKGDTLELTVERL